MERSSTRNAHAAGSSRRARRPPRRLRPSESKAPFLPHRARLVEVLAESLATPIPESTPRRVYGAIAFLGKATAVVGMRREIGALEEARALFARAGRRLLTLTADTTLGNLPAGVVAQPAYEWMLAVPEKAGG